MKILIALDATPRCGEIVAEIASRPWPTDTSFLLLHILDPFPYAKAPITLRRRSSPAPRDRLERTRTVSINPDQPDVVLARLQVTH